MSPWKAVAILLLVLAGGGCRSVSPPQHLEIDWVASSAEYRALFLQTYRLAGERLREIIASREAGDGPWAVGLDADETLVSNLRYQQEIAAAGEEYSSQTFGAWVARRQAPVLPGTQAFLQLVRELGGKIAIVTNRRLAWCADTEVNLDALGVPYDVILCRGEDREKEARWQSIKDGSASAELPALEIVMFLGDNIKDFPDLDQTLTTAGEAAFEAFGAEYFVLPNPMYGSWAE